MLNKTYKRQPLTHGDFRYNLTKIHIEVLKKDFYYRLFISIK